MLCATDFRQRPMMFLRPWTGWTHLELEGIQTGNGHPLHDVGPVIPCFLTPETKTHGFNQLKIWGPVGKGEEPNLEAVIFCGLCMSMLVFGGVVLYLFLTFPVGNGMTMYLLISCKEKNAEFSAFAAIPHWKITCQRSHVKCC